MLENSEVGCVCFPLLLTAQHRAPCALHAVWQQEQPQVLLMIQQLLCRQGFGFQLVRAFVVANHGSIIVGWWGLLAVHEWVGAQRMGGR